MSEIQTFRNNFTYNSALAGYIGMEREFFITNSDNKIVPLAAQLLESLSVWECNVGEFSFELSACQIESKTVPCQSLVDLITTQKALDEILARVSGEHRLTCESIEVAPETMSLEVFPDPNGRYQQLVSSMSYKVLSAACRVVGTHVHIGMLDHDSALATYNKVIEYSDELLRIGDGSSGERIGLYKEVTENYIPVQYDSWEDYAIYAAAHGFFENPRDCWHMIRLTPYGTIEFRNFGVTSDYNKLENWAATCLQLCQ